MVTLEQRSCHQTIRHEEALQRLQDIQQQKTEANLEKLMLGRFCQGKFAWRISGFTGNLLMMKEPRKFLFSPGFYTAPVLGYKFSMRCSVNNIKGDEFLGIHVHLEAGDDDDILDWPFAGKIALTIKNRQGERDFVENMDTQSGLAAFDKPEPGSRNPVGFGLKPFISITSLFNQGFYDQKKDMVVIVAKVSHDE